MLKRLLRQKLKSKPTQQVQNQSIHQANRKGPHTVWTAKSKQTERPETVITVRIQVLMILTQERLLQVELQETAVLMSQAFQLTLQQDVSPEE